MRLRLLPFGAAGVHGQSVVVSQVYVGGGNTGTVWRNDFVELFNRGAAPASMAGWSVQYASATGATWQVAPIEGTIEPGQYFLVQLAAGAGGTQPLPSPDAMGALALSGTAGKIALVRGVVPLQDGGDLLADRGLRVAEPLRRPAERALVRDRLERDEMSQLDPKPTISLHDRKQW